jgi:hypothetical protein
MEGIESLDQFLVTTFACLVHPDLFRSRREEKSAYRTHVRLSRLSARLTRQFPMQGTTRLSRTARGRSSGRYRGKPDLAATLRRPRPSHRALDP